MIGLIITLALTFVWAVAASSAWRIERNTRRFQTFAHQKEIEQINKVGKWYEGRVDALEHESRQLAEQLVIAGSVPRLAMPIPPIEEQHEYTYDQTGLVREVLDPREWANR